MRYVCAISCCGEDYGLAQAIYSSLRAEGASAFLYRIETLGHGHMIDRHEAIYCRAMSRLYILRQESFEKRYPSLELRCGAGLKHNFVWPMEAKLQAVEAPEGFAFIRGDGWFWLKPGAGVAGALERIRRALR